VRLFGLPVAEVTDLVASVRSADETRVGDAFARIAWTVLVEPGDLAAGRVLRALGPQGALEMLLAADPTRAIDIWIADGAEPARAERAVADAFARWRPRLAARPVVRAIEQAARLGLRVLVPHDAAWPAGFSALGDAEPIALWVRAGGRIEGQFDRAVAVVGARAATGYGEYVATELAGGLAERGVVVISGGAYGIDAAAHRAALAADGVTIAFLAGGLERYYPAGNAELLARVAHTGAAITEVPPGVAPTRVRFLSRNRMLAAASAATIVVEAGLRSGSLNTAHHALAIGRPVGAVPGPVTSPASAGCHRLLRDDGAVCVTSVDDVLELAGAERADESDRYEPTDPTTIRVLDAIGVRRGQSADEIARSSGLAIGDVLGALGHLEVDGVVRRGDAGWVRVPGRSAPPGRRG